MKINWYTVGRGVKILLSMILIPCSWAIIIYIFGKDLDTVAGMLAFMILAVFTVAYFLSEGYTKEIK